MNSMNNRKGIAIPLVLLFVLMVSVYIMSLLHTRSGVRTQALTSLNQRQAYYMAMGGIQQALLKIRLLHREAYDAGCLSRGICPFFNPYGDNLVAEDISGGTATPDAKEIFLSDINSGHVPITILDAGGPEFSMPIDDEFIWGFEATDMDVTTYYTSDTDGSVRQVALVTAVGSAFDPRANVTGTRETVTKSIELNRRIQ